MLFTWSTHNLCIVFPGWRISGTGSLIASLFAIILLTAGYEAVRNFTRIYEISHTQRLKTFSSSVLAGKPRISQLSPIPCPTFSGFPFPSACCWRSTVLQDNENAGRPRTLFRDEYQDENTISQGLTHFTSSLLVGRDNKQILERQGKIILATLYAIQVFYSFFIM